VLVALAAVAVTAAACGGSGSSTTTTSSPPTSTTGSTGPTTSTTRAASGTTTTTGASLATCQAGQLTVAVAGSSGAAGTIELTVSMTNASGATCGLSGYPGLLLLAGSTPLPTSVQRGGGLSFENLPVTSVTLAPGAAAYFNLGYSDVPSGGESSCPAADHLEVTPPNDYDHATIPVTDLTACGGGTIHVSPVFGSSDTAATQTTAPKLG
jgi:hypothetical protein